MIINAFKQAFEGCNRTLESVLTSKRFAEERERVLALARLDPNSDLGIAHNAGALVMTEMFNRLPEGPALKQAGGQVGFRHVDPDLFALTYLLGEELVREAGNCLTDEMSEAAEEWPRSTPKRQLEISYWLMKELQSESQGPVAGKTGDATFERVFAEHDRHLRDAMSRSLDPIFPALYGKWHPNNPANCQGKTQMVIAFAQKAGARCLAVHPSVQWHDIANRYIMQILSEINQDLMVRGLYGVDPGVDEGVACSIQDCLFDSMDYCFHIGCAIELSNGSWVMLDPHARSWGKFPDHWGLPSVYRTVSKYRGVVPGLSLQRQQRGEVEAMIEEVVARARTFLVRSRLAEEDLKNVTSLSGLADYIEQSDDLELLADFMGITEKGWLQEGTLRKVLSMSLAAGVNGDVFSVPFELMAREGDKEFLAHKKRSWLTAFHAGCHSEVCSFLNRAELIHPVIDFTDARWSVSVAAINSCTLDEPGLTRPWSKNEFLLRLSADQTTLYNALVTQYRAHDQELAIAARRCLGSYPVRHAMCERFVKP